MKNKIITAEMDYLRWTTRVSTKYKITNEEIRNIIASQEMVMNIIEGHSLVAWIYSYNSENNKCQKSMCKAMIGEGEEEVLRRVARIIWTRYC